MIALALLYRAFAAARRASVIGLLFFLFLLGLIARAIWRWA